MRNLLKTAMGIITEKTAKILFATEHRLKETAFTRRRSLSFQKVIFMKLNTVKQSNNDAVFNISRDVFEETPVARQSFEEARNNISHTAFKELFKDTVDAAEHVSDMKLYKGYRLLAIDGSTNSLPKSEELKRVFGKSTPVDGVTYCRISICTDVLNEFIFDGEIAGFDIGERKLALKHIENVTCENALFLFDRGYWAPQLIKNICDSKRKFLIRIAFNGVSAVTKASEPDGSFVFARKYSLRFHSFILGSGETEFLVTNLDCDEVSNSELEALYALRWGVETRYNELKNQVGLIRFPGKSKLCVMQDFYAFLTVMNLIASAMYDADELVQKDRQKKVLKYSYKANKSAAINILMTRYLRAAVESDPQKKERMFLQLIEDISRLVIPIRPGRHFQRRICTNKRRVAH